MEGDGDEIKSRDRTLNNSFMNQHFNFWHYVRAVIEPVGQNPTDYSCAVQRVKFHDRSLMIEHQKGDEQK